MLSKKLSFGTMLILFCSLGASSQTGRNSKEQAAKSKADRKEVQRLAKLAKRGDPEAMHQLGMAYMKGFGAPPNEPEGVRIIRASAVRGFAPAQYFVGDLFSEGKKVKPDLPAAVRWYKRSPWTNLRNTLAITFIT